MLWLDSTRYGLFPEESNSVNVSLLVHYMLHIFLNFFFYAVIRFVTIASIDLLLVDVCRYLMLGYVRVRLEDAHGCFI